MTLGDGIAVVGIAASIAAILIVRIVLDYFYTKINLGLKKE
jgi:hypothetical protein